MKNLIITAMLWATVFTTNAGYSPKLRLDPTPVHVVSKQAGIDITTLKVVHMFGAVTKYTVQKAIVEALSNSNLPGDRVVIINSPGGDVVAGQVLIDELKIEKLSGTRIVCVAINNAHSMAFNLLSFCDVRLATAKSTMIVHKIEYSMIPPEMRGTAKNLRKMAAVLDVMDEPYIVQNSAMMHLDRRHYDMYADAQNCWTAEQLLIMGYLQGIAIVGKQ